MIGVFGHFTAQAQIAQHHIEGDIGAHRDHVRVHQAPGGVLGVRQRLLQPLAIFAIHRLEHFLDHRVGQILDQIGQIIDVERSEEHTSELQSLMRHSYAVFCLKKKKKSKMTTTCNETNKRYTIKE